MKIIQWFKYRWALNREIDWIDRCDALGDIFGGPLDGWRGKKIEEAKIQLRKKYGL